jgi:hypothetical protein
MNEEWVLTRLLLCRELCSVKLSEAWTAYIPPSSKISASKNILTNKDKSIILIKNLIESAKVTNLNTKLV